MRQPCRVTANGGNAYHGKRWLNGIGQVEQSFGFQITSRVVVILRQARGIAVVHVEGALGLVRPLVEEHVVPRRSSVAEGQSERAVGFSSGHSAGPQGRQSRLVALAGRLADHDRPRPDPPVG